MSSLSEYIQEVKEKTKGYSEIEVIRYVYINLGQKYSFDLKFGYGNLFNKRKIYERDYTKQIEENMIDNKIICKNLSEIFVAVMKGLDIKARTVQVEKGDSRFLHVFNIITLQDGRELPLDLQSDLENIQSHSRTYCFGGEANSPYVHLTRDELERIDRKIGYIDDEHYYADEYGDLIRLYKDYYSSFSERMQFVLENLEPYNNKMEYPERRWRLERQLKRYLDDKEQNKVKIVDYYKNNGKKREERDYEYCVSVDTGKETQIYMVDPEDSFALKKVDLMEFAKIAKDDIILLEGIPRLKGCIQKLKNQQISCCKQCVEKEFELE